LSPGIELFFVDADHVYVMAEEEWESALSKIDETLTEAQQPCF